MRICIDSLVECEEWLCKIAIEKHISTQLIGRGKLYQHLTGDED